MAEKFIPLAKRSKREQKTHHSEKKLTWGSFIPVTCANESVKVYVRM